MTYRLDGWQDIATVGRYELDRRLKREYEGLAYDLKICGMGYPSPRKDVIKAIHVELCRRESRI